MKFVRVLTKSFFYIFAVLIITVFGSIIYLENNVSESFKIKRGDTLNLNSQIPVTAVFDGTSLTEKGITQSVGEEFSVELKVFGVIPFKSVSVEVVDELHVAVLGSPFGMKIYTEGVLVVNITEVVTENGKEKPAEKAGIKKGDYIISANGEEISTNEDLSRIVEDSDGEKINFKIKRNGKFKNVSFKALKCKETNSYKIGIWIRDSSAGIGTLTFYSPATGIICGLGHGICDEDTGKILELDSGEIVKAEILSAQKGETGSPGQLNGKFSGKTIGKIEYNCSMGVYSSPIGKINTDKLFEVALKQEIKDGKAQILTTTDGDTPRLYDCEITIRSSAFMSKTQNITVTVTDKELLSKTGGIVQGMSGSPIIQNGKLIGALTHVLVDDPTKGYAIFAENMLETAQSVAEQQLKEAS